MNVEVTVNETETTNNSKENAMHVETAVNETTSNPVGWDSVERGFLSDREAAEETSLSWDDYEKESVPPGFTPEGWNMTEGLKGY